MKESIEELKKEMQEKFDNTPFYREAQIILDEAIDRAVQLTKDDMNNIGIIAYQDGMLKGRDAECERIIGVIDERIETEKLLLTTETYPFETYSRGLIGGLEHLKKLLSTPTQNTPPAEKECVWVKRVDAYSEITYTTGCGNTIHNLPKQGTLCSCGKPIQVKEV